MKTLRMTLLTIALLPLVFGTIAYSNCRSSMKSFFKQERAIKEAARLQYEHLNVSSIAIMARNGALNFDAHYTQGFIPDDTKYFLDKVKDKIIILGRKTYNETPPDQNWTTRLNIVVTRDPNFKPGGSNSIVAGSLEEAMEIAGRNTEMPDEEIFIGGGGEIYKNAMNYVRRVYLTVVEQDLPGSVYFPEIDKEVFKKSVDDKRFSNVPYRFQVFERIPSQ
jgi:dihydrofolate reductase